MTTQKEETPVDSGHARGALAALAGFLAGNTACLRTVCDTPGCGEVFEGSPYLAVDAGWRHDPTRLFRCPGCTAAGWPGMLTPAVKIPASLYKAWAGGDASKLTTWLDRKFGPLPAADATGGEQPGDR
jgi:hypothetical protein